MSDTVTAPGALGGTEDDYLTPAEFAGMMKVSPPTIYRWASEDPSLPAIRYAKTLRFPRTRLLKWLRDREQGRGRSRAEAGR